MAGQTLIQAARGDRAVDLLLKNARLINVFSGKIVSTHIAVAQGRIAGFGEYTAMESVDLKHCYVAPGFIDAHVHIESAMTNVSEFARIVAPRGTTTVIADPHEIANVLGVAGIDYMIRCADNQPIDVRFSLPSCVPATNMETAGAVLSAEVIAPFQSSARVAALAEVMNFPGVIFEDPDLMAKIADAKAAGKVIDGHAPGLSGRRLHAYLCAGIASDHECTTAAEALEKLEAGMHIMVREGTCARNLETIFPVINEKTAHRMMWCTDDRHPHDLMDDGHVDAIVRKAIGMGLDPVTAIQMGTLHPARYFRLDDVGAVAPGYRADMIVFSDLNHPVPEFVFAGGVCLSKNGRILPEIRRPDPVAVPPAMNLMNQDPDFSVPVRGKRIRLIEVVADQVVTGQCVVAAPVRDQEVVSDVAGDILKIAVVERHRASGNVGIGFVRGFGLKKGALASSVAHDSHNIIVVGAEDEEMTRAVRSVVKMGGGFAAASDGRVMATLPLPIAGLMSDQPVALVREQLDRMINAARELGSLLSDPFMALGFLALPVIPVLKITDMGLVDVAAFKPVSLFAD